MKRALAGIALAAIGIATSITFAATANAASGSAQFDTYNNCVNTGESGWVQGHHIITFECHSFYTMPGGPNAWMNFTY